MGLEASPSVEGYICTQPPPLAVGGDVLQPSSVARAGVLLERLPKYFQQLALPAETTHKRQIQKSLDGDRDDVGRRMTSATMIYACCSALSSAPLVLQLKDGQFSMMQCIKEILVPFRCLGAFKDVQGKGRRGEGGAPDASCKSRSQNPHAPVLILESRPKPPTQGKQELPTSW